MLLENVEQTDNFIFVNFYLHIVQRNYSKKETADKIMFKIGSLFSGLLINGTPGQS